MLFKKILLQLYRGCTKLKNLDLSYCTAIEKAEDLSNCLNTLPNTLNELSLCGVMIKEPEILVESITRLGRLKVVRFCGVPAVNDESLEKVSFRYAKTLPLFKPSHFNIRTFSLSTWII